MVRPSLTTGEISVNTTDRMILEEMSFEELSATDLDAVSGGGFWLDFFSAAKDAAVDGAKWLYNHTVKD